jgi:cytochrome c oxidase subunit 3
LVGSAAGTITALGLVTWWKGLFGLPSGTWWLFAAGFSGILLTMIGWWSEVVKEANRGDHTPVVGIGLRYGMVLFIASEVMFFVAWFWMFFEMALFHQVRGQSPIEEVRTAWATWPPHGVEAVPPWELPLVNTLTLLLSGTTVTWAHHALQQGDRKSAKIGLVLTIILGVLFTSIQAYEYTHILEHKYFFSEEAANSGLYGSAFFMATGFHGFHVIIGTIFLTVCLLRLMGGGFTPKQHFGFEAAAWYWHFVDVVWLFLFAFVYVIFGAHGAIK